MALFPHSLHSLDYGFNVIKDKVIKNRNTQKSLTSCVYTANKLTPEMHTFVLPLSTASCKELDMLTCKMALKNSSGFCTG